MKLRHFLTLVFCILAVLPILLLRMWPQSSLLEGRMEEVQSQQVQITSSVVAVLELYHRDLTTTLRLLTEAKEIPDTVLQETLKNLAFRQLCIVDFETGQLLRSLARDTVPCPEVVPEAKLLRLQNLAANDAINIGEVATSLDGSTVLHAVRRMGDSLAFGIIDTAFFLQIADAISGKGRGRAVIVDQAGHALAHPVSSFVEERRDLTLTNPGIAAALKGRTGADRFFYDPLQTDVIVGYAPVPLAGWAVMIIQPINELIAIAEEARRTTMTIVILGASLAVLLAMVVGYAIARPLEAVTAAAGRVSKGDLSPLEPDKEWFQSSEVAALRSNFADMVARLKNDIDTINVLAFRDGVTQLANRTFFRRRLMALFDSDNMPSGVLLFIDLDGFKQVNDTLGHDVGDKVLAAIGWRLLGVIRRARGDAVEDVQSPPEPDELPMKALVARMGGDEFAIYVPDAQVSETATIAQEIVNVCSEPIVLGNDAVRLGASVGVARYPADASDYSKLLKAADLALYEAKRAGKRQYHQFNSDLLDQQARKRERFKSLVNALATGQLVPFFQPQFRMEDMSMTGVEAFVRWLHPTQGVLAPGEFLPKDDEDPELLRQIDQYILKQSVGHALDLCAQGVPIHRLSLNLSRPHLEDPALFNNINALPSLPFQLCFELDETFALDELDEKMRWRLDRLAELGVEIDLDDFGAGQASILALMNLRPKHLKIDPALTARIANKAAPSSVVRSITDMAHALGIAVIAEGVDEVSQVHEMRKLGVDVVQGFELGHPMPAEQLLEFFKQLRTGSTA